MKFSKIFISVFLICFLSLACNDDASKKKEVQVPSTENQGIKKTKLSPREIDSIESLKKKKSKRYDTLKPSVATVDFSE